MRRLAAWMAQETTGGVALVVAAGLALAWANSPWRATYHALTAWSVGPADWGFHLTLAEWAADGLLALFFFVVGVELKHELAAGSLSRPREAAVPVVAAVGGMVLPALLYTGTVLAWGDRAALRGWAIPTATDIAFALAVLALCGRGLPRALRTFLLTLAVVDDLLAIVVIAVFYADAVSLPALGGALVVVAACGVVLRMRRPRWWVVAPLAVTAWALMHASGVHATIAGVLVALTVPARPVHGERTPRTVRYGERWRPFTSGVAVPLFAFTAAGVTLVGAGAGGAVLRQPVVVAIGVGLVWGKLVGVMGTTAVVTRLTRLRLPQGITLRDMLPVGVLTGMGFTVSLLIARLSFADGPRLAGATVAVLMASGTAAVVGAALLRWDARRARHRAPTRRA